MKSLPRSANYLTVKQLPSCAERDDNDVIPCVNVNKAIQTDISRLIQAEGNSELRDIDVCSFRYK